MKIGDITNIKGLVNVESVVKISDTRHNCFYGIKVNDMYYAGMRNGKALFTNKPAGAWEVATKESDAERIKDILRLKDVFGTQYAVIVETRATGYFEIKPIREA